MNKIVLVMMLSFFMLGCVSKPVLNIERTPVPTLENGQRLSMDVVRDAIFSGAKKRGWVPRVVEPGLIVADISVRSHFASVEIRYDETSFSIFYKDSRNLKYNNGTIHRNYNNWVLKLSRTIEQELGVNSQRY